MTNCVVCGVAAKQKCAGCSTVFYCSKEHQILDWKNGHKNLCKPYEVKRNDKLGRYMVASRNLKAGEVLFREYPVAFGPKMSSSPICLGCHKFLTVKNSKTDYYRCSKCAWPLCSKLCENLPPHQEECRLMVAKKYKCPIKNNESGEKDIAYYMILPLRVLLLKKNDPKTFEKVMQLESHVEERMQTKIYQTMKPRLVPFIQKILGNEYTEQLIMTVAGILDTNCFEIPLMSQNKEMGGLFLISLILSHDCLNNTKHYVNKKDGDLYEMTFETTVAVKKGEMLTTTYIHLLKPTLERRFLLKQNKCFDCDCNRCTDPTELSTHGSSFCCKKCTIGKITPDNPLNNSSLWTCNKCLAKYEASEISSKLKNLQQQIDNLNRKSPNECEEFLIKNYSIAPPTHLLLTEVKYILCLLYGNINGYQYKDLSDTLLHRKITLCHEVLEVYDVLDPGRNNQRTNVVFEINCAKIIETKRNFGKNMVTKDDAEIIISEALANIKDSYDILILENENKNIMDNRLNKIIKESFVD